MVIILVNDINHELVLYHSIYIYIIHVSCCIGYGQQNMCTVSITYQYPKTPTIIAHILITTIRNHLFIVRSCFLKISSKLMQFIYSVYAVNISTHIYMWTVLLISSNFFGMSRCSTFALSRRDYVVYYFQDNRLLIVVTEAGESLTWKCINIATNTQSSLKGDMNITFIIKVNK